MSSPVRGPARAPDRASGTTGEHRVLLGVLIVTTMTGRLGVGRRRRPVLLTCLALVALGTLLAALPLGFGPLLIGRIL